MTSSQKIFVAGHRGLVGSAITRALQKRVDGGEPVEIVTRSRAELNLLDGSAVQAFFLAERPARVVVAAAKVGGIKANNDFPVDFLLDNLKIQNHLIESAHAAGSGQAAVSGEFVHLPEVCAAADQGRIAVDRGAGADQRRLRHRQDCRDQALPVVPQAVRIGFHQCDAHEHVRAIRQFRSEQLARPPGDDPQVPSGQGGAPTHNDALGDGLAPARVFCTPTTWRMPV